MQRWIVLTAVLLVLAAGGGGYGYWKHRQNSQNGPDRVWLPVRLNDKIGEDARKGLVKQAETGLRRPEVLNRIVKDLGLAGRFGVASEEAAAAELSRRLFIEIGEANPPADRTLSLNIGVRGIWREHALLSEITDRLMKDVEAVLGIKAPEAPLY